MSLTSHTKQRLIAQAHSLHPIVIIGNDGLTQAVLLEIDRALFDHELIKIRMPAIEKSEKTQLIQSITSDLSAECLKVIGHIAILYKPSDKDRKKKAAASAVRSKKPKARNGDRKKLSEKPKTRNKS